MWFAGWGTGRESLFQRSDGERAACLPRSERCAYGAAVGDEYRVGFLVQPAVALLDFLGVRDQLAVEDAGALELGAALFL